MKTSGYTVNILPTGTEFIKFDNIIKKLADEYKTFIFDPHITLLGQASDNKESALELMGSLTSNQKPFTVTLNKVDFQDYFFRALFVLAEKTEPLLSLHEKAKRFFGKPGNDEYIPHLSLLYAEFPTEIKEKIIKEIGTEQPSSFVVSSIWLYKTEGESNEWYPVKEFPFKP